MTDKVFGELYYQGGWCKNQEIEFWGKKCDIKIVVSAYKDEAPNEEQQKAYSWFLNNLKDISEKSLEKMKEYLKTIREEIILYGNVPSVPEDVFEILSISQILFMETGSVAVLCSACWDDHGTAALCTEREITAGPQDIVWMA